MTAGHICELAWIDPIVFTAVILMDRKVSRTLKNTLYSILCVPYVIAVFIQ